MGINRPSPTILQSFFHSNTSWKRLQHKVLPLLQQTVCKFTSWSPYRLSTSNILGAVTWVSWEICKKHVSKKIDAIFHISFFIGIEGDSCLLFSAPQEMPGCQRAQSQQGISTQTEFMHLVATQLDMPSSWDTILKSHLQRNKTKQKLLHVAVIMISIGIILQS